MARKRLPDSIKQIGCRFIPLKKQPEDGVSPLYELLRRLGIKLPALGDQLSRFVQFRKSLARCEPNFVCPLLRLRPARGIKVA
jgi:hypothetical protein